MALDFFQALENRRSIYVISKESPIADSRIQEIVEEAVKYTPSSFNSQSARVVVLLGEQHDKLWDITTETLRGIVNNEEAFQGTADKMSMFKNGYGTVLFFEDTDIITNLQNQFEAYKDNFPLWGHHANGMLQLVIWTALEAEGLGATLQHYNPVIDAEVKSTWDIPAQWQLVAQMPFGKPAAPAGEKTFQPVEERVKVYK
ncbi:nitroreductase family protein [Paenibacillus sp. PK4536]|jgi:predicted oxidoreductase (fatty acid repression mutant protein)|uniref:Putative nitroreductase HBN1 n=1 Tax=Paenibacillus nuruki TaxID=1886670 RepID=A0A1E3KXR9_9BACL|nr:MULTISPECIES: nitroreductase family protein [Paenibacillus]ODP26286.1 putative nitroreductase HBN1 [Paenibacillus nuruki]WIM40842.1 nitroreductase family protein [Paenibacillus sp. PK4536]